LPVGNGREEGGGGGIEDVEEDVEAASDMLKVKSDGRLLSPFHVTRSLLRWCATYTITRNRVSRRMIKKELLMEDVGSALAV